MGEGEGGGGQDKDLLGPPSPSSPPTEGRGDFRENISIRDVRLTGHRPGLPGRIISFHIVPLDPACKAWFAGHILAKVLEGRPLRTNCLRGVTVGPSLFRGLWDNFLIVGRRKKNVIL